MKRILWIALAAVVCLLAQATLAFSQQNPRNGSIAGTITDPSGAAIAGASVELRSASAHIVRAQKTGRDGRFRFSELSAGSYQVIVAAPGFEEQTHTVTVQSGAETAWNAALRVAPARATVDVEDDAFRAASAANWNVPREQQGESRNTAEIVSAAPGVSLRDNGHLAAAPMLHGLGDERAKIVVDGATLGNSCPNHMNPPLSYASPSRAARVTVLAGITPVSLGGDSLGGTISVESPLPVFATRAGELREEGSATGYYRSNGENYGGSLHAWFAGGSFGAGYDGAYTSSGNYTDGAGHKVTSTYSQSEDHTITLAARRGVNLFVLQGSLHHTPYEGFPGAQMDMTRNYATGLNLRYRRVLGDGLLDARVFWQNTFHEMNIGHDKSTFPMPMNMPMDTHGRDFGYSVRYEVPLGKTHTLRAGNELHRFRLDDWWPPVPGTAPMMGPDTFLNINDGRRTRLGTYVELASQWNAKWTTLLGLRNDTVWTDAGDVHGYSAMYAADAAAFNAAGHARTDANLDLTALARYDANVHVAAEFGYARKSHAPNLYERYAWSTNRMASGMIGWFNDGNYYVGNLNLKSEVGNTVSGTLGVHGKGPAAWEVKVTPYFTYVEDYIDVNSWLTMMYGMSTFAQLQFANHDARLYGGDLSGSVLLWNSAAAGKGTLSGVGSWVHGSRTDSGKGLYQMMPVNARLSLEEEWKGATAGFGMTAADRKSRLDPNRLEQATPGYALFDLHAGYRSRHVEGSLNVDNLFNRAYALPLGGVNFDDFMASMWMAKITPLTGRGRSVSFHLTASF